MIGCVIISDRVDLYLPETYSALDAALPDEMSLRVIDDRDHQLGLAGAAQAAWDTALDLGWDYLLHWEEDFLPNGPIPLDAMRAALEADPKLAQVTLKRQAWNEAEKAAGGIVEASPDAYTEGDGLTYHRECFSLNPSLVPRWVLEMGWPDSNEAGMTARLTEDPDIRFAFLGGKFDPPLVTHVGAVRGQGWAL